MSPLGFIILTTCWLLPLALAYVWFKQRHAYWRNRNIPNIPPVAFLGNLKELLLMRISFGEIFRQFYSKGQGALVGIYMLHTPALLLRDPKLIQSIFIENADVFQNRYEAADEQGDAIGALTLPLAKHRIWRHSRRQLAKLFTVGMLKDQLHVEMQTVGAQLAQHLQQKVPAAGSATLEVKKLCALYTIDITALLMYDIDAHSLQHGDSQLWQEAQALLRPTFLKALHFFVIFFLPSLAGLCRAKVFTERYTDYMRGIVHAFIAKPKQPERENLLTLLLAYRQKSKANFAQQENFLVSQAAIFLLAGFETSASLLALTLYELAKQPAIQQTLRQELCQTLETNKQQQLTYEQLQQLPYLNMIVAEALRLYPTAAFINREYTPLAAEHKFSLAPFADYQIPEGMPVYVSILGIHRDEQLWPNAEHFEPTRFAAERLKTLKPMSYLPFGCGPHGCIGRRLGILQVKLALATIFQHYTVATCADTPPKITFDPDAFMLHAKGDINLKFIDCNMQKI